MATVTLTRSDAWGAGKLAVGSIQFGTDYVAGGDAVNFSADAGITTIYNVLFDTPGDSTFTPVNSGTAALCQWDYTNLKVKLLVDGDNTYLAEPADNTNTADVYVKFAVFGV